jgi:N-acetylmuramoyl-L-alanine amidase
MREYEVRKGECLAKIASDFGFADFREIYNHPANAEFKKKRPNPFVIKAGDRLSIPDKPPPKVYQCETGKEHTFVMERPETFLSIYLRDGHKPLANKDYILSANDFRATGRTDENGLVNQPVPARATSAELYLPDDDISFDLRIGDLDPLTEVSGLMQRLENLGFASDDGSGFVLDDGDDGVEEIGTATTEALRRFQVENGLEPSGEKNDETITRLRALHDKGVQS